MNAELRDAILALISRAEICTEIQNVDEDSSVVELQYAIGRYNDEAGALDRLAPAARRQLDLEDLREYEASRKAVTR